MPPYPIESKAGWARHCFERLGCGTTRGDRGYARHSIPHVPSSPRHPKRCRGHPATSDWQHELSVCLNPLGDLATAQGNLPEAQRRFGESLRTLQRLAESDPANAAWQRDLSYSDTIIGQLLMQQQRWAEALPLLEQSLAIDERLAASDPSNVMWQQDVQVSRRLVDEVRDRVKRK